MILAEFLRVMHASIGVQGRNICFLWTTVMRVYLIRATLCDALSDKFLECGMVSNSYMLRHVKAEVTYLLHLSYHQVSVHEDLLTNVLSWTSVYCIIVLG